jgi:hypothetical protein
MASTPTRRSSSESVADAFPTGLLGALAFAGAGGGQNLCQSNWIRDKGFAMGEYVPQDHQPGHGRA